MDKKIEIPRRNCMDQFAPAEKAIYNAMQEVERAGTDLRLINAITHLQQAKEFISDYVDEVTVKEESEEIKGVDEKITPIIGRVYLHEGVAMRCLERTSEGCGECFLIHDYCSNIVCSERLRQDGKNILFREV